MSSELTLVDVLRYHQRKRAQALEHSRHPRAKYNTRMIWEAEADMHGELARVIAAAIASIGRAA